MAQTDTGLGWNAKSEWLLQSATQIAFISDVGGPDFPGGNVPYITSTNPVDVVAAGFDIGRKNSWNLDCFLVTLRDMPVVFGWVQSGSSYQACVASPGDVTFQLYRAWGNSSEAGFGYGHSGRTGYDSATNLSYLTFYVSGSGAPDPDTYYQHQFSSVQAMLAAVVITNAAFTKTNPGYAVACVAKWKTPNGTAFESPILISTDTDYVDMQTDAGGISVAKLNMLYQGRKFFMAFYNRPYTGTLQTSLPVIDRSYSDAPTFTLDELFKYIAKDVYANIQVTIAPDPYQEGEGSEEAGGDGEEDESDDIDFTDAPTSGIAYSGFITIFTPDLSQLQSLASYMWTGAFDVTNWRKIFANPMDAILGLHIIPISPGYSGNKEVKVGGMGTGVSMDYTTIRYHKASMGTCDVPKKWGAYLDYSPYTKTSIFLPYIGFRELDTDDIMGRSIALQYIIDILTGACVAELKCGSTVLYSWEGNCANPVPITSNSWTNAIGSALGIAATVAGIAVTGGASAPMAVGAIASVGANSMNLKPTVSRSGALGGSGGFIAHQTPYFVRSAPNLVIPSDQNKFIGYPSFVTASLGSLTGYNEISSVHLEGIPATGNELAEIESLLKGGVIF